MTDTQSLIERLRYCSQHGVFDAARRGMMANYGEAAAELQRLLDDNERLEAALIYIAETSDDEHIVRKARAALTGDSQNG